MRVPLLAILLGGAGCVTVRPLTDPAQFISQANPKIVYVTYKNRSVVGIAQPRVRGDSLFGTLEGPAAPVALHMSHVQQIRAAQPDKGRTTLLIAGLTVFTATGVYLLIEAIGGEGESCDYTLPNELPSHCT